MRMCPGTNKVVARRTSGACQLSTQKKLHAAGASATAEVRQRGPPPRAKVGEFDVDLVVEFFQGFVNHADVTLHIDNLRGHNAHHQAETVFKAFGRALRMAVAPDAAMAGSSPSTKGVL